MQKGGTASVCVHLFLVLYLPLTSCCPFSESSSQALSVFNKAGLLDVVVQCLERHPYNVELAISAGMSNRYTVIWLLNLISKGVCICGHDIPNFNFLSKYHGWTYFHFCRSSCHKSDFIILTFMKEPILQDY